MYGTWKTPCTDRFFRTTGGRSLYHPPMAIYIGHTSALEYWGFADSPESTGLLPSRTQTIADADANSDTIERLGRSSHALQLLSRPLHLLVPHDAARLTSHAAISHVARSVPPGAFLQIAPDVYMSSPEYCYLCMAGALSEARLAEVGFELCGSYALDASERGFHNRKPLTSVAAIATFLDAAVGIRNVKKARHILRYIADNSASPRETDTTIILCFPGNLGGYAFELPALNRLLRIADGPGRTRVVACDLLWARHHVAIEYDSAAYHSGVADIDRDSKRRAALEAAGIKVITITRKQLASVEETHKVALALARNMGRELRPRARDFYQKRLELRNELFRPREHGISRFADGNGGAGADAETLA